MWTKAIKTLGYWLNLGLLLIITLWLVPALAGVYKWTDDHGKVHYTDSPPPTGNVQEIKIKSYDGPAVVTSNKQPVGSTATTSANTQVTLYSTSWCGYCKKATAYLSSRGISYKELDVETSAEGKSGYARLKGRGVPIILVGEQRMNGFNQASLEGMLKAAGY